MVLDRFKTAFTLMKDSLLVMKHNPTLLSFPIVSGIAGIAFLGVFLGVTFGVLSIDLGGGTALFVVLALGFGTVYLGTTFISAFFTAALVHQTRDVLTGGDASLGAGMRGAWEVKRPLLIWAFIAATVGVVLNAIEDSNGGVGRALSAVFGVAWTLMTFFIIPVIVFEKTSVRGMFERSAEQFKATWGETPLSLAGVGAVSFVVAIPFAGPGILLIESYGYELLGFALVATGAVLGAIVSHTFKGIIKTSLYFYATEGTLPDEFDDVDPNALGRSKSRGSTGSIDTTSGGFR